MRFATLVSTIVLAILLLLCVSSIAYATPPSGYAYVKTHTIIGSTDGALSNYQVKFIVHSNTGIDNGQDVYLNGHSLSWPNDIRFTDANDMLLNYWIESYDANSATVWVKVDNIPASPATTTINVYYGRSGDLRDSNGYNTFVAFDDFSTNRIGTYWAETYQVNGGGEFGDFPDTHTVANGGYLFSQTYPSDRTAAIEMINPVPGYVMCSAVLTYSDRYGRRPPWDYIGFGFSGTTQGWTPNIGYWGGVLGYNPNSPSDCINIQFTNYPSTGNNVFVYRDNNLVWQSRMSFDNQQKPVLSLRTASMETLTAYWRDFYARNFTPNEPTHGVWGHEATTQSSTLSYLLIAMMVIVLAFLVILIIAATFIVGYVLGKRKNK